MTGKSHKQYAICGAYVVAMLFYVFNITGINYYLGLMIALLVAKVGGKFPDLDHAWCNIGEKTIPHKVINTLIHITGGKHRSWQTHSIDICIWVTVAARWIPELLYSYGFIEIADRSLMLVMTLSFAAGYISHLFSDMLTSEGVYLLCFMKLKVKLVPKKILNFRFSTDSDWEKFNYKLMRFVNIILGFGSITFPMIYRYKEIVVGYITKML